MVFASVPVGSKFIDALSREIYKKVSPLGAVPVHKEHEGSIRFKLGTRVRPYFDPRS